MSVVTPDILKPHYPEPNIFCVQNYPGNLFGVNEKIALKWHPDFKEWYYEDCSHTMLESWFRKFPHLFLFHDSIFPPSTVEPVVEMENRKEAILKLEQVFKNKAEFLDDWIDHAALAYDFFNGLLPSLSIQQEAVPEQPSNIQKRESDYLREGFIGKERSAWPLGGFAPGKYTCRCCQCAEEFRGDKRAVQCLDCASKSANKSLQTLQSELSALREEKEEYRKALELIKEQGDGFEAKYAKEVLANRHETKTDAGLEKVLNAQHAEGEIPEETELKSTVELPGGETSRTLEELYKAVPQPWRGQILRCTGVGTALQPLLEYVARFAESHKLTTNTQDK